jgi:hypothetical protein
MHPWVYLVLCLTKRAGTLSVSFVSLQIEIELFILYETLCYALWAEREGEREREMSKTALPSEFKIKWERHMCSQPMRTGVTGIANIYYIQLCSHCFI